MRNINDKPVFVAEIRAGRQKSYHIKTDGLENGVYIRGSGTTRPADRDMSRELYYECDVRSFDSVIRRDIKVTDEDIKNLCAQMKEVAFRINPYRGQNEVIEVKNSNHDLDDLNKDHKNLKDDLETRLSELFRKNPELTHKALGEALAVSATTIKRTLTKMQREGKVIREGSNRKGKWTLTEKMK